MVCAVCSAPSLSTPAQSEPPPSDSANQLRWELRRNSNHGMFLTKRFGNRTRTTIIKNTGRDIPNGTLAAILRGYVKSCVNKIRRRPSPALWL